jgi:3-methylcrotonyl-CoA carboxylase alpha subunit
MPILSVVGLDLVEWQLRVARGEPLPITEQEDIPLYGHALEARVYAENPYKGFLPSTGNLFCLRPPMEHENVRVDTGVVEGDDVTIFYDPMISKLITYGENREEVQSSTFRFGYFVDCKYRC